MLKRLIVVVLLLSCAGLVSWLASWGVYGIYCSRLEYQQIKTAQRESDRRIIVVRNRAEGIRIMKEKTLRVISKEFPAKDTSDQLSRCRFVLENEEGERCTVTCSADENGFLVPEELDTIVVGDLVELHQGVHPDEKATLLRIKKQS